MLVTGKTAESEVAEHIYDLILELHSIDSSVLLSVLPQLEFKLRVSCWGVTFLYLGGDEGSMLGMVGVCTI